MAYSTFIFSSYADESKLPALKNGDLVFQTSGSGQSKAIMIATLSPYSHMGIVKLTEDGPVVVEAVGPVKETPLGDWIKRGNLDRLAVMRYGDLSEKQAQEILSHSSTYYGRDYDIFFFDGNSEIYCSELAYLAYQKSGITLGQKQKLQDLFITNPVVKKLIKKRLSKHPLCNNEMSSDECWEIVMEQELITPVSIANDNRLSLVYSNYSPFH